MIIARFKEIRVGAEIDAKCTKCRMVTNHHVVAMVDGAVKRVICLTCDSQHNYYKPAQEKKTTTPKTRLVDKKQKKVTSDKGKRIFEKWTEQKNLIEEKQIVPTPYTISGDFTVDEAIMHSKFGLGFIEKLILPNKIEVRFDNDIKILAMKTEL